MAGKSGWRSHPSPNCSPSRRCILPAGRTTCIPVVPGLFFSLAYLCYLVIFCSYASLYIVTAAVCVGFLFCRRSGLTGTFNPERPKFLFHPCRIVSRMEIEKLRLGLGGSYNVCYIISYVVVILIPIFYYCSLKLNGFQTESITTDCQFIVVGISRFPFSYASC